MQTMDFFGHQDRARRATSRLVVYFVLAVLGITLCIYAAAKALLVFADGDRRAVDPPLLAAVSLVTLSIIGFAMLFKTAQLKGGGGKVAKLLGGRRVPLQPSDPAERMLRNIVEEMSIASGVPVPEIYVLDDERGINAFAAGWSPADAAVAVTRGALEQFDRDELQGVIAHEFSHVFHGDMRLNIRLMGVLFGIVCIATIGRVIVRTVGNARSSGDKKGGVAGVVFFGLAVMVVGYLGVFFARLIQAAVSRQREFLADASAVQYTRNPRGLGLALAKIGGLTARLQNPHTEEASHMLFADGIGRFLGAAMATHPPLERRIERVLPGFSKQLRGAPSMVAAAAKTPPPPIPPGAAGLASGGGETAAWRPGSATVSQVMASVGELSSQHVAAARSLLAALPLDLAVATHEPERAQALVAALLLDRNPSRRDNQLRLLDQGAFVHEVRAAFLAIARLDSTMRLPLLELAIPALRRLPDDARRQLRRTARALALADEHLSPFEFVLLRTIERHVRLEAEPVPRAAAPESLMQRSEQVAIVLSVLARVGAGQDEERASLAFARGRAHLATGAALQLVAAERSSLIALENAIERLRLVSPLGKRNLIAACAETVAADGRIEPDELDLLRALAELWDCPVPLLQTEVLAPA